MLAIHYCVFSFISITEYQANPLARFINFIIVKRIKWVTEVGSAIFK